MLCETDMEAYKYESQRDENGWHKLVLIILVIILFAVAWAYCGECRGVGMEGEEQGLRCYECTNMSEMDEYDQTAPFEENCLTSPSNSRICVIGESCALLSIKTKVKSRVMRSCFKTSERGCHTDLLNTTSCYCHSDLCNFN